MLGLCIALALFGRGAGFVQDCIISILAVDGSWSRRLSGVGMTLVHI
jgi:hypothetical protein